MDENQVICIDANFTPDQLAFWLKYKVKHPLQDKIYSVRDVIKHTTGDTGLLLTEIENPKVPTPHPVLGSIKMEPTWAIRRFAHLDGSPLSMEEVREMIKISNLNEILNF